MYLKRIETLGFKSFADKTIINYTPGVTGVVGPNGSGKSNVVDAVRWVLGEQSIKQLRGGTTMTDVIFSGSKSRAPHNYAYVTLVLDNQDRFIDVDYNEIEVTRKVFRSGESEYLLNGTKCRLKDISDIVIDSGLGKESFNIISQDKVQALLNSKPEDRRYIFEEAAGVLKYRKRKESAARKLKTTQENLNRVDDILSELENQVEPLRVQSENALKYLETKEALEEVEIALLAHEIYELTKEYDSIKKNCDMLNESIIVSSNDEVKKEQEIKILKETLKDVDVKLESFNQDFIRLNDSLNKAKSEKKLFDERRKYNHDDALVIENKQKLQDSLIDINEKINSISSELSGLNTKKSTLDKQLLDMESSKGELVLKKGKLKETCNSHEKRVVEELYKINAFERQNDNKLFSGVSAVINNPKLKGIIDIVSNIVSVDIKFAKAIDIALAGASQNIVCETKQDAKHAIDYLNQTKRGRATFLPLDNINVRKQSYDFSQCDDIYGFANDFIGVDDKYLDVIESLVGAIVIAKDLDSATNFFKKEKRYRIITLNGEVISPRGSITGGNKAKDSGVFSARFEYENSKNTVKELEDELTKLRDQDAEYASKIVDFDDSIYKIRVEIMQIGESINIKTSSTKGYESQKESILSELSGLSSISDKKENEEENRILNAINDFQTQINNLSSSLNSLKIEKGEMLASQDVLSDELKAISAKLKDEKKQLNILEIKNSRVDVKLENNLLRLAEEYNLTFEKAFEDYHLTLELEEARARVKTLKAKINSIGFVNINAIEEYKTVNERFTFLSSQRDDILDAKSELLATIEELDKTMTMKFKDTFTDVSEQFSKMFGQLFGGGNASLSLTDPKDLLNTGIEISAQPPGKKLQHLTLLSGGEKALSTLVLLFAILKVRPVPFCILDEVEAALDEANLARFAKFLGEFSGDIQFIIITHRKVTMENADVLYGVTMQESGVSKLVSVHLKEAAQLVSEV